MCFNDVRRIRGLHDDLHGVHHDALRDVLHDDRDVHDDDVDHDGNRLHIQVVNLVVHNQEEDIHILEVHPLGVNP